MKPFVMLLEIIEGVAHAQSSASRLNDGTFPD